MIDCYNFRCIYENNCICEYDNQKCDLDYDAEKCRNKNKPELRKPNPDVANIEVDEFFRYLPFFSCQNLCANYNSCDMT